MADGGGAVPGKDSHNNTFRALELSLLAAGTDGYADTEGRTTLECTVRVLVRFMLRHIGRCRNERSEWRHRTTVHECLSIVCLVV